MINSYSGQSSTVTPNRSNNYGESQYNSTKFNILDHLHKLTLVDGKGKQSPSQGEYYCPVCGAENFKVNLKTGKYNTFSCDCNTGVFNKQSFIRAITGEPDRKARSTGVTSVYKRIKPISEGKVIDDEPPIQKVLMPKGNIEYCYYQWDDEFMGKCGITDPFKPDVYDETRDYLTQLVTVHRNNDGLGGKKVYRSPADARTDKALPYGIKRLLRVSPDATSLFIAEGERTADSLNKYFSEKKINAVATTGLGGANGGWKELDTETIYKIGFSDIVLCPDRDKPGFDHMINVYKSFFARGIICRWLLVDGTPYENLPTNKGVDMSDMIDGGHLDDSELTDAIASPEDIAWLSKLFTLTEDDVTSGDVENDDWTVEKFDAWLQQDVGDENDDWIIDDLISTGSNIIAAPSGTGKSIFATQIAMAIITGKETLGSEVKKQGKVIYHCSDEPVKRLKDRLIAQGILDTQDRDKFIPLMKVEDGNRWNYSHIKELERMLKNHKPVAFILDSLRSITKPLGIKEKDEQTGEVVTHLRDICEKYSVALVIVHHNRKDSTSDLNSVVGSSSIVSPIDVVWSMSKNPSKGKFARRLTLVKNRQGEDEITKHLLLDDKTLTFTVNYDVSDEDEDTSERKISTKDKILDCLKRNAGNWVTLDDLIEATEAEKGTIRTAASRLKTDKLIEVKDSKYRLLP